MSNRIGLDKPILQRTASRGNRCRRIVAPKVAGSSPVGHPPILRLDASPVRLSGARLLQPYCNPSNGELRPALRRRRRLRPPRGAARPQRPRPEGRAYPDDVSRGHTIRGPGGGLYARSLAGALAVHLLASTPRWAGRPEGESGVIRNAASPGVPSKGPRTTWAITWPGSARWPPRTGSGCWPTTCPRRGNPPGQASPRRGERTG